MTLAQSPDRQPRSAFLSEFVLLSTGGEGPELTRFTAIAVQWNMTVVCGKGLKVDITAKIRALCSDTSTFMRSWPLSSKS